MSECGSLRSSRASKSTAAYFRRTATSRLRKPTEKPTEKPVAIHSDDMSTLVFAETVRGKSALIGKQLGPAQRGLASARSSTNRQSAFASRICSTVRQFASSSRGRADEVREALRPRDRDVEAVPREQEVEPARDVLAARARHRVEDDRRLLALELVDGADPDAPVGDLLAQAAHLRVVRRDDDDVLVRQRRARRARRRTASRAAARSRRATTAASSGDATRCPSCSTGEEAEAVPVRDRPLEADSRRLEPALVERLRDETRTPPAASARSARGRRPSPAAPSRRRRAGAPSTDASAPGGCAPCETCGSWFGSPSRTRFARRRPDRERVGERDLPALVDEQRVDVLVELLAREEARRARDELELRVEHVVVRRRCSRRTRPRTACPRRSHFLRPRN